MFDRVFTCVFAGIAVSTVIMCALTLADIKEVVTPAAVQALIR